MLLLDYLLNVSVGISAEIGAVVSAIPTLQAFALPLCLLVLATLTFFNLRGIRESGLAFITPVMVFIVCMSVTIGIGLISLWTSGGHPQPVVPPPKFTPATESLSA